MFIILTWLCLTVAFTSHLNDSHRLLMCTCLSIAYRLCSLFHDVGLHTRVPLYHGQYRFPVDVYYSYGFYYVKCKYVIYFRCFVKYFITCLAVVAMWLTVMCVAEIKCTLLYTLAANDTSHE